MTLRWWSTAPTGGDILWCHFAANGAPALKPRPSLVLQVDAGTAPEYEVQVVYGTSQRITNLHRGEFAITRARHAAAYVAAGLSYDTKFDFRQAVWLPFNSEWFTVPPGAPWGQLPKLGILHASMSHPAAVAYVAANSE